MHKPTKNGLSMKLDHSKISNSYNDIVLTVNAGLSNFSGQVINHTVFFYPNGTPFLYLEIKVIFGPNILTHVILNFGVISVAMDNLLLSQSYIYDRN